ncbi:hypothetical protein MASR1M46_01800 [Bacteroidales bacterium]
MNMVNAINDALDIAAEDRSVAVYGEDVGEGGVFRVTEGLQLKHGAERVFDFSGWSRVVGTGYRHGNSRMRLVVEMQFMDLFIRRLIR